MVVGTTSRSYSLPTVAQILGITPADVRELMRTRVLTGFDPGTRAKPKHKGKYKKWHFSPDEVEAYRVGGIEGVVAYRQRNGRRKGK